MSHLFSPAARMWLAQASGLAAASLVIEQLPGSTSSSVFRIADRANEPKQFVLRVLDQAAWLADEPDLAAHESAALREAERANLPAPRLIASAEQEADFGAPVVLMSWLAGRIELCPANRHQWLGELARQLAAIHQHAAPDFAWQFRSWVDWATVQVPSWSNVPAAWSQALALLQQPAPAYRSVFIHRDYHPTNVLWQANTISGTVDWINACRGPAGVDVAHCRTNLALMFGPAIAEEFLARYRAADPTFVYDPYWEIDSLFDSCLPEPRFYPPWQTFGLDPIPVAVLRQRLDQHLVGVLQSVDM